MNKETRIKKISEIVERKKNNPYGIQDIRWNDRLVSMNVYEIPLEYLVYNKYNGRILSRTKSLESQGHKIDAESDAGEAIIEDLLWESNKGRNAQTLESIKRIGQEKVGIITKDGIIIDGNRRAMILRRSGKSEYFRTVVLEVTLEEDPTQIEKLETTYQMGQDEKLGYNAIEKYLKAKVLQKRGVSTDDISDWMGESKKTITDYLEIMGTMEDYLDYCGYHEIYTQLDDREDQFINLTKWLATFYGESSGKVFDGYKDLDVDDLKTISYDYIRAKFEGKKFRNIGDGLKPNHFFGDKTIWEDFREAHFKKIQPIKDAEEPINFDSERFEAYLNDRDGKFTEKAIDFLNENVDWHYQQLKNRQAADQPIRLVGSAINALESIDQRHKAFSAPDVIQQIEKLNDMTASMLKEKSPKRIFSSVIKLLESVKIKNSLDPKDELLDKIKDVQRIAYQLEKDIKSS